MEFKFNVGQKIREAWPLYKKHLNTFLILMALLFLLQLINQSGHWYTSLIAMFLNLFLSYIWIKVCMGIVDNVEIDPFSKKEFPSISQIWDYFKTSILSSFFVILGFVLFIIPGIYVSGRLLFSTYLSVEKKQGARNSVRESWNMTRGYGWKLFWKSLLIGLFMFLGIIALVLGLFITYPIGFILTVMLYREFYKMKKIINTEQKIEN